MGDPDLSPPASDPVRQDVAGRGLVVFPAPVPRTRRLAAYVPFLLTVILGAAVVASVVVIR